MSQSLAQIKSAAKLQCIHCDEPIIHPIIDTVSGDVFCCHGCQTVHQILHDKGLENYYEIKHQSESFKRRAPVNILESTYAYIDDQKFLNEFSYFNTNGERTMEFYLEGIHCLACLWLIEKIPNLVANVITCKLDLEKSTVTVSISSDGKFSPVAKQFNQLGYRPHPLKKDQSSHEFKLLEDRKSLLRIGIAAAGMSNIMIYAVSIYAGAQGSFANIFNVLTVLFGIPVLTYSAYPFYQNAWRAIKNKKLSIDIPIAIALISGLLMGLGNLALGITENYFDSLTMLVFLLLLSRYFLRKIQENALNTSDLHYFYQGESVHRIKDDGINTEEVHPQYIKIDDYLKVMPNEFFPVDAIITQGETLVNSSLLTGESLPIRSREGDHVFAGTQNLSKSVIVKTKKVSTETKLGRILKNVEKGWTAKAPIVELADKISQAFIWSVFALSALLFAITYKDAGLKVAIEQVLTLLIVTCPCALALATPLAFTQALTKAADKGIIIKNDAVIQRISNIKNLFFDKTGTLTYGQISISKFEILHETSPSIWNIIHTLESNSKHPVAKALLKYAQEQGSTKLDGPIVVLEMRNGVSATISEHKYEIRNNSIFCDDLKIANFQYSDVLRQDTIDSLAKLKKHNLNITLISGDNKENVEKVAKSINFDNKHTFYAQTPEDKNELISKTSGTMMVGDGANDAIALSHADVGVAVFGAMDISLRAADVFLATPGISAIEQLVSLSKETIRLIKRNFAISLAYNSVSVIAVFMGLITPLSAAIIMPVSSLTVLASTLIGTKELRQIWKS